MKLLKANFFAPSLLSCFFISANVFAQSTYPSISGETLFEFRADSVTSTNKDHVKPNNFNINIDADFNLNFSKNWSLINDWKIRSVEQQNDSNPEIYRQILSERRGLELRDDGLVIEQLKGQYANEDARFFFGKFNPEFGTAFRKEKRIGVFVTDFTKDYEIREKIGAGFTAILENTEITANLFFNDTTFLSDSAFNNRGRSERSDGLAGDTSTPSSYTIAIEGQDLFNIPDLFYNAGYRSLRVDSAPGREDETGYVGGLEYLLPINSSISFIPFVEIAKINNFTGESNRDSTYTTIALIAKYSRWTAGMSHIDRQIKSDIQNIKDKQMQYFVGYKFENNVMIDVSKADIKEDGHKASLVGLLVSYVYNF
ncbi:MAG: hypothetical protein ACJAZX_000142 [Rickettsiales bacterium]|jgi:hypothetical protein